MAVVAAAAGCTLEQPSDDLAHTHAAILSGTTVTSANPPENPGTVAVYHGTARPCSGTLIRKQWVLTAMHCVTVGGATVNPVILPLSSVKVVRATSPGLTVPAGASSATGIMIHDTVDLALIRISPELASPAGLTNGPLSSLPGSFLRVMGYGRLVNNLDVGVENAPRQTDIVIP